MKRLLAAAAKRNEGESPENPGMHTRFHAPGRGMLGTLLRLTTGALLLVLLFTLSLLLFVVLVAAGLLVWGYVWWRTRQLRKQLRERPADGQVFEGEARIIEAEDASDLAARQHDQH